MGCPNNSKRAIKFSLLVVVLLISLSCSWFSPAGGVPQLTVTVKPTQTVPLNPTPSSVPTSTPLPSVTMAPLTNEISPSATATLVFPLAITPTSTELSTSNEVCHGALLTRLKVGDYAYIVTTPWLPNRIRTGPGAGFPVKGLARPGAVMKVLDGPFCSGSQLWWKVDLKFVKLTGWVAEGDSKEYWIAPCPTEGHCPPL
jgi:hypothetical protein